MIAEPHEQKPSQLLIVPGSFASDAILDGDAAVIIEKCRDLHVVQAIRVPFNNADFDVLSGKRATNMTHGKTVHDRCSSVRSF